MIVVQLHMMPPFVCVHMVTVTNKIHQVVEGSLPRHGSTVWLSVSSGRI